MTTYGLTAEAVEKLQKTLDFITEHPERHNQATWLNAMPVDEFGVEVEPDMPNGCGTYGCVAGWLAMHALGEIPITAWIPNYAFDHDTDRYTDKIVGYEIDYSEFSASDVARQALEVGYGTEASYQLERVFGADLSLGEIWFLANELADDRLKIPATVTPIDPDGFDYELCPCGCQDDD